MMARMVSPPLPRSFVAFWNENFEMFHYRMKSKYIDLENKNIFKLWALTAMMVNNFWRPLITQLTRSFQQTPLFCQRFTVE